MSIIMYSTQMCPKCKVLKTKLQNKEIDFYEVNNVNIMEKRGIMSVPVLEVDGEMMDFSKAVTWVNGR